MDFQRFDFVPKKCSVSASLTGILDFFSVFDQQATTKQKENNNKKNNTKHIATQQYKYNTILIYIYTNVYTLCFAAESQIDLFPPCKTSK